MITAHTEPTIVAEDEGQSITLSCTAAGSPAPTIHWFYDETQLLNMDRMNRVTISEILDLQTDLLYTTSNLTINPLDESDAGDYMCVADNSIGSTSEQNLTLIVFCKS